MKYKRFIVSALAVCALLALASCGNKKLLDTTYTFTWAVLELPGGQILQGEVENWRDFADGDQIQVKIDDVTYLVHSSNIVLMTKRPSEFTADSQYPPTEDDNMQTEG